MPSDPDVPQPRRDHAEPPRILLFSMRNIATHVARCSSYELEDTICASDGVDLVAPAAVRPYADSRRATRYLMERLGRDERLAYEEPRPKREYELFFAVCLRPADLRYVSRLRRIRQRCRRSACLLVEVWPHELAARGPSLRVLEEFDQIFTNMESTAQAIEDQTGRPCRYLPAGIDALRFCPFPDAPPRTIDVYSMGRRNEEEHRVLKACADRREIFYVYDTVSNFNVNDARDHRALIASLIRRARYFIAYPAKFEEAKTGRFQEMGPRYLEGAAGGAVMIGAPPRSPAYAVCFDWPDAVVPTGSDRSRIAALIADLEAQPARIQEIRYNNVVNSLRRHDWVYRWRDVLGSMGLRATAAMAAREEHLARTAQALDTRDTPPVLSARPRPQEPRATAP